MWRATQRKGGSYNEEDGVAGIEKMLERRIEELPVEERDNEEQLNKVYKEVVGQDGHGRVLGRGVGIRQCGKCSTSQTEVEKIKNTEIKQLRKDAEKLREETEALRRERDEQEARHTKELETVKNDLKTERDEQKARHNKELERVKSEISTEIKAQVATMFANALFLPQTPNTSASTIFGYQALGSGWNCSRHRSIVGACESSSSKGCVFCYKGHNVWNIYNSVVLVRL